jgi:phosphate starvation-inducible protein PhoH and related proteins
LRAIHLQTMTIVLEDKSVVPDLCGVNDENLKIIETLLQERVFSKGNELFFLSEDREKQRVFRNMIEQLEDHARTGHHPGPDLIRSIFRTLRSPEDEDPGQLIESMINIPGYAKVFPKSLHQARYVGALQQFDIVFGIGPAGTGKTYLAIASALAEIIDKQKTKLVLTRPVVEAGENLGFLPGDLTQKISPYLRPLYDAIDSFIPYELEHKLEDTRIIEIAPLAYMRGRSLQDSIIILDEAQNTTKAQMKMFLTRIGKNSKAIITGDVTQIDLPKKNRSGLVHAEKILRGIPGINFTFFDGQDVIRNPLIKKIIEAYEKEEKQ